MSDTSSDNVSTQALLDRINTLSDQVYRLQNPDEPTPHREDRVVPQLLVLSGELIAAYPSITAKYFFQAPSEPVDDVILKNTIVFPKNRDQQCSAPSLELPWPQDATTYLDKTLQQVQESFAFLTRPLDDFVAEVFTSHPDENTKRAVADYAHTMRSQLALAARRVTDTRLDYYVQAKGLKPAPSDDKGTTIPQDVISAHIKKAEAYTEASAPRRGSSSRAPTGRRYGYRGFR
ncbi:hypothetical protein BGZ65_007621, partial [Modicella reniformis]